MNTPTDPIDEFALFAARSDRATREAAHAFARLLKLAEERDSGQIPRVARFIAATYNGQSFQLDPFELRAVDSPSVTTCCAAWTRCAGPVPTCTRSFLTVTRACVR